MNHEKMQADGWRQCAVGQKTTQFCGMLEQAVAAEREKLNKKIAALESDVDHFFKLSGQYLERANKAEEAVALERERCAKVCDAIHADAEDSIAQTNTSIWVAAFMGRSMAARDCAAAIRRMK